VRGIAIGADWTDGRPGIAKGGKRAWERFGYVAREELIFDAKTSEYLGIRRSWSSPAVSTAPASPAL
jgi:hypothetical protein